MDAYLFIAEAFSGLYVDLYSIYGCKVYKYAKISQLEDSLALICREPSLGVNLQNVCYKICFLPVAGQVQKVFK